MYLLIAESDEETLGEPFTFSDMLSDDFKVKDFKATWVGGEFQLNARSRHYFTKNIVALQYRLVKKYSLLAILDTKGYSNIRICSSDKST